MIKQCRVSGIDFEVTDEDISFLDRVSPVIGEKKFSIPLPTLCPDERSRRRLCFRDERYLYHRKCDFSGEDIITPYSLDKPYKVYKNEIWWGDDWDGLDYGRDFDFSRPFFEQFQELRMVVPKPQSTAYGNLNCPYINRCANCRSCYMCFCFDESEDCFYSENSFRLKSCIDCSTSEKMEFCISCMECNNMVRAIECYRSSGLSDSTFCFDCHNSDNLIFCWNLNQKRYCIFNQQYTKEEYEQKKKSLALNIYKNYKRQKEEFMKMVQNEAIHRYARIINSENCMGNHILYSKNCTECFEVSKCENLKYVSYVPNDVRFAMDGMALWDNAELVYDCISVSSYSTLFSNNVWESDNVMYSDTLKCCSHNFGCASLKHKKYCILNKQYSEEEYSVLGIKILEHMKETGEWGEFFPAEHSPFCYNESVVMEYFPLTKSEVLNRGYSWKDDENKNISEQTFVMADDIDNQTNNICGEILKSEISETNYKITEQEFNLYKELRIPIPRIAPKDRHRERLEFKLPWKLWDRKCLNCGISIKTAYKPGRSEKIYCEKCYLEAVFN